VLRDHPIDVVFLAMAVSDFAPRPTAGKLRSDDQTLILECPPTPKVIRSVRDWAPGAFLVGFKLLSGAGEGELIREATAACVSNRADLTVANDLSTVQPGRHVIHLVRPGNPTETYGPDGTIAERLVDRVFELRGRRSPL
jgi:phosphopantothenoylcysteine synthetase/decarboxylase